ncbi:hypothetical protein NDU88_003500, partial [Pleurodeles waltl]
DKPCSHLAARSVQFPMKCLFYQQGVSWTRRTPHWQSQARPPLPCCSGAPALPPACYMIGWSSRVAVLVVMLMCARAPQCLLYCWERYWYKKVQQPGAEMG